MEKALKLLREMKERLTRNHIEMLDAEQHLAAERKHLESRVPAPLQRLQTPLCLQSLQLTLSYFTGQILDTQLDLDRVIDEVESSGM